MEETPAGEGPAAGDAGVSASEPLKVESESIVAAQPSPNTAAPTSSEAVVGVAPSITAPEPAPSSSEKPADGSLPADAPDPPPESGPAEPEPVRDPRLDAFEAQLKDVRSSSGDFDKWVKLLSAAEKLADLGKVREAYDEFLSEYPLCYGYWKKYADIEHKNGSPDMAKAVFERGVAAVPNSVELWVHYSTYLNTIGASSSEIRSVFSRGTAAVGEDYLGHPIWDAYLDYETAQKAYPEIVAIYRKVLHDCQLRELNKYMTSLKQFAADHSAEDFMTAEEHSSIEAALRESRLAEMKAKQAAIDAAMQAAREAAKHAVAAAEPSSEAGLDTSAGGDAPGEAAAAPEAGDEGPSSMEVDTASGAEAMAVDQAGADAMTNGVAEPQEINVSEGDIKDAWIDAFQTVFQANKAAIEKTAPFESAIKRPYFHVKPLDQGQLTNWWAYLDFKTKTGSHAGIVRLFERCLVPCAAYHAFWERYVRYLEAQGSIETASSALTRAYNIHCKRRPEIYMFAARFYEAHQNFDAARTAYDDVLQRVAPGSLEAAIGKANFERRQGNVDVARSAYDTALEETRAKQPIPEALYTFTVIKYAHFLQTAAGDRSGAQAALDAGLQVFPYSRTLWESAMHLAEIAGGPDTVAGVLALREKAEGALKAATVPKDRAAAAHKLALSLTERAFDFADVVGTVGEVRAAETAYSMLTAAPAPAPDNKRKAEAPAASPSGSKAAKTSDGHTNKQGAAVPAGPAAATAATAAAAQGAYYGGQGYPGYGYGQAYPGYPPAAGYGYGAYPGYQ